MSQAEALHFVLHPGDVAVGERGDSFETLLGSCVAIVLTDPRRTVGAMCHIVHSGLATRHAHTSSTSAGVALDKMVRLLEQRGLTPRWCEAYVYGGGNMFPQLDDNLSVGDDNADWALQALKDMGIKVLAAHLRGTVYRRLRWTVGPDAPQVDAVSIEGQS